MCQNMFVSTNGYVYVYIYIHLHPKFEEHFGKCVFQKKHRTAKSDAFGLFHPKALKGLKG